MTALSDALTAAQRSALAALEKAYVAERIDADGFHEALTSCGITDQVDQAFLVASLDVLKEWGVSAPNLTERLVRENGEPEKASDKQRVLIADLCRRKNVPAPDLAGLSKPKASELGASPRTLAVSSRAGSSDRDAHVAAQDRELDGLRKLYGQKFNAIGAALGHATEAQDKLAFGDVDAAMEEIGKVVSVLVDA